MVESKITYEGDLRCKATHGPSGVILHTDAPVDNHGRGESFSPTDLLATALGSCILTIVGIVSQRHNIDISGATVSVAKEMVSQPVRRVGRLAVTIRIPTEVSPENRQRLQQAADTCPVKKSLHPDIEIPVTWLWG